MTKNSNIKRARKDKIRQAAEALLNRPLWVREAEALRRIGGYQRHPGTASFQRRISDRSALHSRTPLSLTSQQVGPTSSAVRAIIEAKGLMRREMHRMQHDIMCDALTGAYNRRYFDSELVKVASRAERTGHPYAIIMIDGDNFKRVNDTFGHQAGDAVLKEIVRRMKSVVRTHDTVCRYGGEEFAIILPECRAPSAVYVAERIRAGIANDAISTPDGHRIRFTASFGVVDSSSQGAKTMEGVLKRADQALYIAKGKEVEGLDISCETLQNPKNRTAYFDKGGRLFVLSSHLAVQRRVTMAYNPRGDYRPRNGS